MKASTIARPDQSNPAYHLALAIDALRSHIEDHQDYLRALWEADRGDMTEQPQWNAEDAAALLEQAVVLIDPLFHVYE